MNRIASARLVAILAGLYAVFVGVLSAGPMAIVLVASAIGMLVLAILSTESSQTLGAIVAAAMLLSVARSFAAVPLPGLGVILALGLFFLFGRSVLGGGCCMACNR